MRLTVRLSGPDGLVERLSRDDGTLTIGRAPDCDLVLVDPDRTLSNRHCQISRDGAGWVLTDTSTNGVFIGGSDEPLGRGRSVLLGSGDVAHLGSFRLDVVLEPHPIPVPAPGARQEPPGVPGPLGSAEPIEFRSPFQISVSATPAFPGSGSPSGIRDVATPFGHRPGPVGGEPEPWLDGIESGAHAHGMMPGRAGWDAPPLPSFVAEPPGIDPLPPQREAHGLASRSEHLDAIGTTMRLPVPASVLPPDWDQPEPSPAAPRLPAPRTADPETDLSEPFRTDPASPDPVETGATGSEPIGIAAILGAAPAPHGVELSASDLVSPEPFVPASAVEPAADRSAAPDAGPEPAEPQEAPVLRPWHAIPATEPAGPADAASLLAAFLEGAGIDAEQARQQDPRLLLRNAGAVLRTAVSGMREILSSRALVKAELRVEQTMIRPRDNNSLKFVPDLESCIMALLGKPPPGFLPGTECMQQSLDDVKRHELAMVAALGGAISDLLVQLDPERIRTEADEEGGRNAMFPAARKARYWQVFERLFRDIRQRQEDPASRSLLGPMASAYARQISRVS